MAFTPNFQLPVVSDVATAEGLKTAIDTELARAYAAAIADAVGTGGGGNVVVYGSVSAFTSATIDPSINAVPVVSNSGDLLWYVRQPGASGPEDLYHPNGSTWAKASPSQADILAAVVDVTQAIDRIPLQTSQSGTPTLVPQTPGSFSISYTTQSLSWQRVNRMVEFELAVAGVPTLGANFSGALRITGLPYPAFASGKGGGCPRQMIGVNLQYYIGGNPFVPASVIGAVEAGQQHLLIGIISATGEGTQFIGADRLKTGTPFRMEFWGKYEMQV